MFTPRPTTKILLLPVAIVVSLMMMTSTLVGCAGPATPLGALWATDSSQVKTGPTRFLASIFGREKPLTAIEFEPKRQVLHGPSPMTVIVRDSAGIKSNYKLTVRHNGMDVTPAFMRQARVTQTNHELVVRLPVVRLTAKREHQIEVVYNGTNTSDMHAYARFEPPSCKAFSERAVLSTGMFTPGSALLRLIERASKQTGFNPAFTTALIAQESGFNPNTVSWARAIGLTQVTPIADLELSNAYKDWPRYPGLNDMSMFWMKAMILSGQVNASNEWRLDAERSIIGGLSYAGQLAVRWSQPENMNKIKAVFEDAETAHTKLVLASYNSGFSRVMSALNARGRDWLSAPELKEGRRYVNRIFSYCDHFSEPAPAPKPEQQERQEVSHAHET